MKDWKQDLDYLVYGTQTERYYEGKKPYPYIVTVAIVLVDLARLWVMNKVVCRIKGHDLEDRSPANCGETGRVDVCCNRCGECWGGYW